LTSQRGRGSDPGTVATDVRRSSTGSPNLADRGPDVFTVVTAWLAGRVVFVVGWFLARVTWGAWSVTRPLQLDQGLFAWDGAWYRDLAVHGYGHTPGSIRFFPGYPLLGRFLGFLPGGPATALVVIANLSFLLALALVLRLSRLLSGDPVVARRAVWLVGLWPASFVSVMAYSEPLAMVLVLVALLGGCGRRWTWAAPAALAAALVRPTGVLLVVPLAVVAARVWAGSDIGGRLRNRLTAVSMILAAPAGALLFAGWSWRSGHGFWEPVSVQRPLRGGFHEPLSRVLVAVWDLLVSDPLGDGLHAPFALLLVGLVVVGWLLLPRPLAWYGVAVAAVALGAGNLNSLERYYLAAPTLLVGAAMLPWSRRVFAGTMVAAGAAGVGLTGLAYVGRYVP